MCQRSWWWSWFVLFHCQLLDGWHARRHVCDQHTDSCNLHPGPPMDGQCHDPDCCERAVTEGGCREQRLLGLVIHALVSTVVVLQQLPLTALSEVFLIFGSHQSVGLAVVRLWPGTLSGVCRQPTVGQTSATARDGGLPSCKWPVLQP